MKSEHVIGQKAIRERNVRMAGKFAPLGKTRRGIVQKPLICSVMQITLTVLTENKYANTI